MTYQSLSARWQPAGSGLLALIFFLLVVPSSAMSTFRSVSPDLSLLAAVRRSDLAAVRTALQHSAKVDAMDAKGRTALRLAVEGGRLEIVKHLLTRRPNAFLKNRDGATAVSRAVELHRPDLWKAILIANRTSGFFELNEKTPLLLWAALMDDPATAAALFAQDESPKSKEAGEALLAAAGYGRAGVVKLLLDRGVDVNVQINGSDSPLMAAVGPPSETQTEIVKLLLDHGADVHARDRDGWTALMHAARNGNGEAVKLLLARGAEIEAKANEGQTAVTIARQEGRGEIVALLERARTGTEDAGYGQELARAVEQGDVAQVQALLSRGGDVNARDDAGLTLLMKATIRGQLPLVKLLLQNGARVDETSLREGYSTLFWAAQEGRTEVAVALIVAGARVNELGPQGTPLTRAAELGHLETVRALLDHGAAVNGTDSLGETALMKAAEQGQVAIVQLLLDRGARIDARNQHGDTALSWAAGNGWTEIVRLLLAHGARVHMTGPGADFLYEPVRQGHAEVVKELLAHGVDVNGGGRGDGGSPLMIAAQWGQTDVAAVLIAHGADVNRRDRSGKTALDYALQTKDPRLIRMLRRAGASEGGGAGQRRRGDALPRQSRVRVARQVPVRRRDAGRDRCAAPRLTGTADGSGRPSAPGACLVGLVRRYSGRDFLGARAQPHPSPRHPLLGADLSWRTILNRGRTHTS
jgi:ankyrin repeat protein